VARGVMVKLGAILGAIGFGGLLAIFAAFFTWGQREIGIEVEKSFVKINEKLDVALGRA
jgi:hypothetical protein